MVSELAQAYEISVQQKEAWLGQKIRPQSLAGIVRIQGELDVAALCTAVQEVVALHEVLRTTFKRIAGLKFPRQVIAASGTPDWRVEQPSERLDKADPNDLLLQACRQASDLESGPTFHALLLEQTPSDQLLVVWLPTLCADFWTLSTLVDKISRAYEIAVGGSRADDELTNPLQYADYAGWQAEELDEEMGAESRAFWARQSDAEIRRLRLPYERVVAAQATAGDGVYQPGIVMRHLDSVLIARLEDLLTRQGWSREAFFLAAWFAYLQRVSGQRDFALSYLYHGRPFDELSDALGLFEFGLPLRGTLDDETHFNSLVVKIGEMLANASEWHNGYLQTRKRQLDAANVAADPTPVGFRYREQVVTFTRAGLSFRLTHQFGGPQQPTLLLDCLYSADKLALAFEHEATRFPAEQVERLADQFLLLLTGALADPASPIAALPILGAEERRAVNLLNDNQLDVDNSACLPQLFEAQAARSPQAVAVVCGEQQLTYAALNEQANRLARRLRARGAGPESFVAILCEPSVDMVVAIMGVLKAGAAYLPLDTDYPWLRLKSILDDAQPVLILTQQHLQSRLADSALPRILLDADRAQIDAESTSNLSALTEPEHPAYLIFTSGTSGNPKGVLVRHSSLVNLLAALRKDVYAAIGEGPLRVALNGPVFFDTSVKQLIQLLGGHTLHIISAKVRLEPETLFEIFERDGIDVIDCTPSQLSTWVEAGLLSESRRLPSAFLVGGEAINTSLWDILSAHEGARFFNLYGPTECTVDATVCEVGPRLGGPAIGMPLANIQLYVLDSRGNPTPLEVAGELYIGGAGVARGYLNDPALTAAKFVPDPFSSAAGARLYRTGDLGRRLPDGSVEFLGRTDQQVKIRGYRIEPNELASVLQLHPAVQKAIVKPVSSAIGAEGGPRLVAYYVARRGSSPTQDELREFLRERLPSYMLPHKLSMLDAIPLTSRGKPDFNALLEPVEDEATAESEYVPPGTPAERTLAAIWGRVIGVDRVGIHDNFFQLGGDSIMCIQVTSQAKREGLLLSPIQLFRHQTIAELARVVQPAIDIDSEQGTVSGTIPLTPIQCRFLERDLAEPHYWNQAVLLEVPADLGSAQLETAFQALVAHHDALRLRFYRRGDEWEQVNAASESTRFFSRVDFSALEPTSQRVAIERHAAELQGSLNLSTGPLIRVAHFDLGPEQPGRLLIVVHHMAIDGVSWRILLEDLESVLDQLAVSQESRLPAKTTSFRQWAMQLEAYGRTEAVKREADFWLRELESQRTEQLAGSWPQVEEKVLSLDPNETQALLRGAPAYYRARVDEILLSALSLAVARSSGQGIFSVDVEGHGRGESAVGVVDLSHTVGWFTTIYPVQLSVHNAGTSAEALRTVKEALREVPGNGLGYGLLRYGFAGPSLSQRLGALPRPAISFNYLGQFDQLFERSRWFRPAQESAGRPVSQHAPRMYALEVNAVVGGGRLDVHLTYSPDVWERSTIDRLSEEFLARLRALIGLEEPPQSSLLPSDFPLVGLTRNALDRLIEEVGEIEDIYPLSPVQTDMLAKSVHAPRYGQYVYQFSFVVNEALDAALFERAWQLVISGTPELRVVMVGRGGEETLQVVKPRADSHLVLLDWQDVAAGEEELHLQVYLRAVRERGFNLDVPPPVELALATRGDGTSRMVASFSLLAFDAPSFSLLVSAALDNYRTLRNGQEVRSAGRRLYRDYVGWTLRQDPEVARNTWQEHLAGFTTPIPVVEHKIPLPERDPLYHYLSAVLTEEQTGALLSVAQKHQLTLYTILQGVWALLLHRLTNQDDLVFGAIVSGRPPEFEELAQAAGRFANTLPIRVHVRVDEPALTWFRDIQRDQFETMQYGHIAPGQINSWIGHSPYQSLYQSLLVFENVSLLDSLRAKYGDLILGEPLVILDPEFPLRLIAGPSARLALQLLYQPAHFESATVERLFQELTDLLARVAAAGDLERMNVGRLMVDATGTGRAEDRS